MFQRYIQLSYWLYQNYTYYNQTHDFNESYLDQLCNSITRCGSVCIKFTQWITPILELTYVEENDLFTKDREKPLWLTKLESFYENCEDAVQNPWSFFLLNQFYLSLFLLFSIEFGVESEDPNESVRIVDVISDSGGSTFTNNLNNKMAQNTI